MLQFKDMFPNLPQATIIFMHQASLDGANISQGSSSCSGISRTVKIMTQEPTRYQVLVPLDSAVAELIVTNAASAVQSYNKGLVEAHSKLRIESVYKSLPLTTTMVNSKNLNKSNQNLTLSPGIQDSSQHVGKSLDSLNLLSRTGSRAGK